MTLTVDEERPYWRWQESLSGYRNYLRQSDRETDRVDRQAIRRTYSQIDRQTNETD